MSLTAKNNTFSITAVLFCFIAHSGEPHARTKTTLNIFNSFWLHPLNHLPICLLRGHSNSLSIIRFGFVHKPHRHNQNRMTLPRGQHFWFFAQSKCTSIMLKSNTFTFSKANQTRVGDGKIWKRSIYPKIILYFLCAFSSILKRAPQWLLLLPFTATSHEHKPPPQNMINDFVCFDTSPAPPVWYARTNCEPTMGRVMIDICCKKSMH